MGTVALFMLLVEVFTATTHWADCCVPFFLSQIQNADDVLISPLERFRKEQIGAVKVYLHFLELKGHCWVDYELELLSLAVQHSGLWSNKSHCSFLVPLGLLVSDQRIQFVQINDGSQSSVGNKVMGTDAGRARKGACHRQRDGWTQTDSVNTKWVWCLVSTAVSSCIIQIIYFFPFSFSDKNKDIDTVAVSCGRSLGLKMNSKLISLC